MPRDVTKLLAAASLRTPASVAALGELYAAPATTSVAVTAALARLKASQVDRLVPLLRVASGTVEEAAPFAPYLRHDDPTVRLLAASACAERGERAGLEALVELLDEPASDTSARSPGPVWVKASLALARLTGRVLGPPLDADGHTRRRARDAWRASLTDRVPRWSRTRREWG